MKTFISSLVLSVFLLSFGVGTSRAQTTMFTFQSYTLGDTLPHLGAVDPVVALDPVNPTSGHQVLENIDHNYGSAAILKAVLPSGKTMADYDGFKFKAYFKQGDVGYKYIILQNFSSMPTGAAFADTLGFYNRANPNASTGWENISIPFIGSASMSDTVYLTLGINCAGTGSVGAAGDTTEWFVDSLQLVPAPVPTTMWTFDSYTLGDTLPHLGEVDPVVALDPVNPTSGHQVLENIDHNYGSAAILKAVLPVGKTMADYDGFKFKAYFKQGDVGYKYIILQNFSSMPTGAAFTDTLGYYNRSNPNASTGWENISIPFTGSASMSDTVYLTLGINCAGTGSVGAAGDTTEWFVDSLQLVPAPVPTTMWTFQSYTLGDTLPHLGPVDPVVALDPVNPTSGHQVLENMDHFYGAATILTAVLPAGKTMADYDGFKFKAYFKQGDVGYKYIILQNFSSMPTGAAFTDTLGYYNRSKSTASTAWENINIPFTGSSSMSGTVYLTLGINCDSVGNVGGTGVATEWFVDSLSLVPKPAGPAPGPVLATPVSGATGIAREATLTWNKATNAVAYHVQVATDNAFSSVVFDSTTRSTSVMLGIPLAASTKYYWRVNALMTSDSTAYSTSSFTTGTGLTAVSELGGLPRVFALLPNYPNPFNPSTMIQYDLPKASNVTIRVYDAIGREVATLVDGRVAAGSYRVTFNMDRYASGVYFVRMVAGSYVHVDKLMLLK